MKREKLNLKKSKLTKQQRKKRKRGRELPTKYETVLASTPLDRDDVPDVGNVDGSNVPKFIDVPGLREKIIEKIRDGHHPHTVARFCGIDSGSFLKWMERGAAGENKDYYDFYVDVLRADAEAEMAGIDQIKLQSYDTWTARAWLLERRYPERWGRQEAVKHDHTVSLKGEATLTVRNELSGAVLDNAKVRHALRHVGTVSDADFEEA